MPRSRVVVIEDSVADFSALSRALKANAFKGDLYHFETAEDFFEDYQKLDLSFAERTLILIDLNLPGMSGHDCLKKLREIRGFSAVPAVCLTSSNNPNDITKAYECGANSYLIKSYRYEDYIKISDLLVSYWLHYNVSAYNDADQLEEIPEARKASC